jgi:acyltransferase
MPATALNDFEAHSPLTPAVVAHPTRARAGYAFVTNVRFVSMMGIVAIHAELSTPDWSASPLNVTFNQIAKFATVCFFVISGFLLGDRLSDARPWDYFWRRVRAIGMPWAVWAGVYLLLGVAIDVAARGAAMRPLAWHLSNTFVSSAFWFVPNMLLSLAILIALRRWLDRWWVGAALLAASLSYGLNLHALWWHDTRHNTALLGFTGYLWLGHALRRYATEARALITKAPWWLLAAIALATLALALGESRILFERFGPDADLLSTLRVSNVAYSLAVFALLFKVEGDLAPPGMDVRRHTYGIHLTHPVVFAFVARAFKVVAALALGVSPMAFNLHMDHYVTSPLARLGAQAGVFVAVYLFSWAWVSRLARTPLARFVGVRE